jgi:hypothetical protein
VIAVDMLERLITDVRRAGDKLPVAPEYGTYMAKAHMIVANAVGDLTALQWEAEHVSRASTRGGRPVRDHNGDRIEG